MIRKDLEAAVGKVVEFNYHGGRRNRGMHSIGILREVKAQKTGYQKSETSLIIEEHFLNGNPPREIHWIKPVNVIKVLDYNTPEEIIAEQQRHYVEAIERIRVRDEQQKNETDEAVRLLKEHGVEVADYYVRYGRIELTAAQVITALANKAQVQS